MNLKKPVRQAHNYNEVRNKLVVFLMKVHGWSDGNVKAIFELDYGHKISRTRVGQIYKDYKNRYTVKSFSSYSVPEKLLKVLK